MIYFSFGFKLSHSKWFDKHFFYGHFPLRNNIQMFYSLIQGKCPWQLQFFFSHNSSGVVQLIFESSLAFYLKSSHLIWSYLQLFFFFFSLHPFIILFMQMFLAQFLCINLQLHSYLQHKLWGYKPFIDRSYNKHNLDSSICYSLHSMLSHFFFSKSSSSVFFHCYSIIKNLRQSPK